MKRTPIKRESLELPALFDSLLTGSDVYDSSCSKEATVLFIDKGCGYYLKSAPKGALSDEALMTRYFYKKVCQHPLLNIFLLSAITF